MAQLVGNDEIESLRIELAKIGESSRSSSRHHFSSSRSSSELNSVKDGVDNERAAWAESDRQPTFERLTSSLFDESDGSKVDVQGKRVVDVTELGALERQMFVEKLIKYIENDNLRLLQKMRNRVDKVGVELPKVEVRYKNLQVEATCEVVRGKPLPTLWNSLKSIVSCARQYCRVTLLLGPPGCGKTTLLKALSGNLDKSLKVSGEVFYNGYKLEEFVPQKTSTYVSQHDLHLPEMTVRETLDFSARCQGVGSRAEIMVEVSRREKQAGVVPDPDVHTYMKVLLLSVFFFPLFLVLPKCFMRHIWYSIYVFFYQAISAEGQRTTLQTDYILKILGLDICADILVGDAMTRGISGGQRKRLTTGEMIIGPTKALFMDEISNGLDSSTTYQIVACLKQLAHIADATILVALLQPAPETFDLFDDIILMEGGKIVYHGPRSCVLEFFEDCGFRCPERKGVADFLQEVTSRKDQAQYWHRAEQSWSYISVDLFCKKFKESTFGEKVDEDLSKPFTKSQSHKNAISFSKYSLSKWELFKACMSREYLLMRRNSFIYVFKTVQLVITAFITMTVFLRTRMGVDAIHANSYMGALFFSLTHIFFDGIPEMSMTVARLPVFYKQRDLYFYPAWSYTIPSAILTVPLSLFEALIWTSLTYFVIGYCPEPQRFFQQFILLFALHYAATSMFRFVASIFRTMAASSVAGGLSIVAVCLFSGFIIPETSMPTWLKWGFWVFPLGYGEIGLSVNEFLAPRWQKVSIYLDANLLLFFFFFFCVKVWGYFFWLSVIGLLWLAALFNIGFTLALTFLNPPSSRVIISNEKLSRIEGSEDSSNGADKEAKSKSYEKTASKRHQGCLFCIIHLFLQVIFRVDLSQEMRERGSTQKQLQLLCDITGVLRPGILTALMGVSGAGKTTLLDVLAGRKTSGAIKGDIRIGGYPKLVILKNGGRIIYSGPLGQHSSSVIKYFEDISGVPKIGNNCNPATWILEVTSTSAEAELGIDFSQIYENSLLYQNNKALVVQLMAPPDSKELHFTTRFSQNGWGQFKSCLWKQHLSYWRSPSYNLLRFMYLLIASLLFGILFCGQGRKINNQQSLFNVLGAIYSATMFLGANNCMSVLPYVSTERSVLYRERFAGMYGSWAYALAQVTIEVPYLLAQAIVFSIITYPMIGYYWSAYKVFWYFYAMFCTLLCYTYVGMLLVAMTPSFPVAASLQSVFFIMFNLFSGFLIPQPVSY
ncbi:hypothetical protein RHGRI_031986 [Rhododendron griersonianum]|uniref:ABC transporter domain-containing protein n=1 Tax=Rhododendron griersonianum TaxID=479676 RepID=A0AAV6IFS3_9ERIC|nr:hypothetical protein RHGRI_031986 [Rhododendron griersonianum]